MAELDSEWGGCASICRSDPPHATLRPPARLKLTQPACGTWMRWQVLGLEAGPTLDRAHYLSAGVASFARGLSDIPKIAAILVAGAAISPTAGMMGVALSKHISLPGYENAGWAASAALSQRNGSSQPSLASATSSAFDVTSSPPLSTASLCMSASPPGARRRHWSRSSASHSVRPPRRALFVRSSPGV